MAVAILGPLTVTDSGGDAVRLGPRDRVVLAALAAWPTETLGAERLADALWGDRPPASWSKVVQGCVARIRKALGPSVVVTSPQGYRLAMPADEVDARRFAQLCERGRELLALGEPDRASYVLGEALALWRGRALVDLDGWPAGRAAAEQLEEMRRDADELRLDADLRAGRSREVLAAAQALAAAEPLREQRWGLLALAQYRAGAQGDALATLRRARGVLVRELGLDPGPELAELERRLLRQDPSLLAEAEPPAARATCPYPGLLPYDVGDAEAFFGRDADVAACRKRLDGTGVLVVVGPSGSGKSSLIRAGLVAALRRDRRKVAVVAPGPHPMDVLTALPHTGPGLVLAVDQCEEVVTQCRDADERSAFLGALMTHAEGGPLVIVLRADQLGAVSVHSGFARLAERGLHLLGAMNEAELRSAIEGPARQGGLLLEPGLVDLLMREVIGEPGALPLLSHALRQTWQRREGRTLTVSGYRDSGGIRDALTRSAEEIVSALPERRRDDARQMFLRLVTVDEDGEVLRRRVPHADLLSLQAQPGEMDAVIQAFGAMRLLSFDRDAATDTPTVEIAHEALLKEWTRLRSWVDEAHEDLRTARRMAVAATDWLDSGRDASFLATGGRLDRFEAWRRRSALAVSADEDDFLSSSVAERARREAGERARQEREQALQRRARSRLRAMVAVLASAALVAATLTVFAVAQQRRAQRDALVAEVRELSAAAVANRGVDPERSILLALRAVELTRSADGSVRPEAREALHWATVASRVVSRFPDLGGNLDWSRDGELFVTEGPEDSGRVEIRSAASGQVVSAFAGHDTDVNDVSFSPDGRLLATTGDDGLAMVWHPETGAKLQQFGSRRLGQPVLQPSFSRDGRRLSAIWRNKGDAGVVRVADLVDGTSRDIIRGTPNVIDLSADGARLAVAMFEPRSVVVVDVPTGRTLFTLPGDELDLLSIKWSPDGHRLASAGVDGITRIWDAATGELRATLFGHTGPINAARWSPDSTRIATASIDGTAKLWEIGEAGGRELLTLSAHDMRGGVQDLVFSADGSRLMTSDERSRAVRIWDIGTAGDAEVANVPADWKWIGRPAFTPNGRGVVAGAADGSAVVWEVATGNASLRIDQGGPVGSPGPSVGLSPGALTVPFAGSDNTVRLWDAASGQRVLTAYGEPRHVALSPDGRLLALSDGRLTRIIDRTGKVIADVPEAPGFGVAGIGLGAGDGHLLVTTSFPVDRPDRTRNRLTIWNWADRKVVQSIQTYAESAAFDPAGARVVGVAYDAGVWDVRTGRKLIDLVGHAGPVYDAVFSPDGSTIATAGFDATVRLWDADSGVELLVLRGHGSMVDSVVFSPDGTRVASVSFDGTLRVWELDVERLIDIAERELTRTFTEEECRQYLHLERCP